jgi:hypothetical protein
MSKDTSLVGKKCWFCEAQATVLAKHMRLEGLVRVLSRVTTFSTWVVYMDEGPAACDQHRKELALQTAESLSPGSYAKSAVSLEWSIQLSDGTKEEGRRRPEALYSETPEADTDPVS